MGQNYEHAVEKHSEIIDYLMYFDFAYNIDVWGEGSLCNSFNILSFFFEAFSSIFHWPLGLYFHWPLCQSFLWPHRLFIHTPWILRRVHHAAYAAMVIISIFLQVYYSCRLYIFSIALKCENCSIFHTLNIDLLWHLQKCSIQYSHWNLCLCHLCHK